MILCYLSQKGLWQWSCESIIISLGIFSEGQLLLIFLMMVLIEATYLLLIPLPPLLSSQAEL